MTAVIPDVLLIVGSCEKKVAESFGGLENSSYLRTVKPKLIITIMKHIKQDAMRILAEISMEQNDGDVIQSFKDVKEIDDLLGILKAKSLINHSRGRKSNMEKRFNEVFCARLAAGAEERVII